MAAHRYWRALGIEPCDGGALIELSEFWLLAGTTRVDAGAALSSSAAPLSGSLASLQDDNTATAAGLARGTVLQWDLGVSPQDVTDIRLGAAGDVKKFPINVLLQWSDDGLSWSTGPRFFGILWPGAYARTQSNPAGTNYFTKFRLYITANGGDAYTAIQEMEIRDAVGGSNLTLPTMPTAQSTFYVANNNTAARAFDRNFTEFTSATWVTDGTALPQWLSIDLLTVNPAIREIAIWAQNFPGGPARAPMDFVFQGSTNLYDWTDLLTVTGATGWAAGAAKMFTVPASSLPPRIKTGYLSRSSLIGPVNIPSLGATPLPVALKPVAVARARPDFWTGLLGKGIGRVRGATLDYVNPLNKPYRSHVRLIRESDGMVVRDAWSGADGSYDFQWVDELQSYTVLAYYVAHGKRAVITDGLTLDNGKVELMP